MSYGLEGARHIVAGGTNLTMTERAVSIVGGLILAAVGARPRPNMLLSGLAILAGAGLAIRGATGHCSVKALMDGGDRTRIGDGR